MKNSRRAALLVLVVACLGVAGWALRRTPIAESAAAPMGVAAAPYVAVPASPTLVGLSLALFRRRMRLEVEWKMTEIEVEARMALIDFYLNASRWSRWCERAGYVARQKGGTLWRRFRSACRRQHRERYPVRYFWRTIRALWKEGHSEIEQDVERYSADLRCILRRMF